MIIDPDTQPEVGRGDLTYSMAITAGALGGTTTVQITPNHSFGNQVGARLVLILQFLLFAVRTGWFEHPEKSNNEHLLFGVRWTQD